MKLPGYLVATSGQRSGTIIVRVRPWHPSLWPVVWNALDVPHWLKPFGWAYVMARVILKPIKSE